MEMRLIDADKLKQDAELCRETTDAFIELIDEQPSQRLTAHWVGQHMGYCSNCMCNVPNFLSGSEWKEIKTPYCPSCGAEMDK